MKYIILFIAFLFLATTYVPYRGYDEYVAVLTQSALDAPTANVLDPLELGDVVWTRTSEGIYEAELTGAFPSGRTVILANVADITDEDLNVESTWVDANTIQIRTSHAAETYELLGNLHIIIRSYRE